MRNDNKLNLMHVTFSMNTGGAEKLVLELVNRVNRDIFKPSVCCLTKKGDLSDELARKGTGIFYLDKKEGVDYLLPFRLAKILKKEKIDIIHTHDSTANLYAIVAAKIARRSRVFNTEHGGIYFETSRKKFINKILCLLNSAMICVSQNVKDDLVDMGLSEKKLTVIPNGIDLEKFKINVDAEEKRKALGLNKSDFVVSLVGRLSKEKNQKMLMDAIKPISEKILEARFLITGDGPLRKDLENYANELGVLSKVKFLGTRTDVPEILKTTDCFVQCSEFESFGLSVLEAMAMRVPVIATDAGGVKEIVNNNVTGILIPKNDRQALVEAVLRIKTDIEFSKSLVFRAKEFVTSFSSIDKMVRNYERLYIA